MNKQHDKLSQRHAIILHKLANNELPTKAELANEFNVNIKTIERDIKQRLIYFPIEMDENKRYKFIDGYSLGKTSFEKEEMLLTYLGLSQVKDLNPEYNTIIDRVLSKILLPTFNSILHIKAEDYEELDQNSETFLNLQKAIEKQNICEIYTPKLAYIEPYKVLNLDGIWYLLAMDKNDNKIKSYLLSKIKKVDVSSKKYILKKDIDSIISNVHSGFFEDGNSFEVVIKVYPEIAHYFKLKEYLPTQKIIEEKYDKSLIISFQVSHYEDIDNIIKSWLPHIEVIEPKEYRNDLIDQLQEYINKNQTIEFSK